MTCRWILLFPLAALFGCTPSPNEGAAPARLYDTVGYLGNVSRLFGNGGKTVTDNLGTKASNIIWKDSLGNTHSLDEYKGEVVVLNMWATWCGPCVREMPTLEQLAKEYKADGVRIIGVSIDRIDEPFKAVHDYAKLLGATYQLIVDSSATTYINYGGDGYIPRTYFIDRDGYIQYIFSGEATKSQFVDVIESLL